MALPLIATVAAKLGIEIGKYIIKKQERKFLKKVQQINYANK